MVVSFLHTFGVFLLGAMCVCVCCLGGSMCFMGSLRVEML